MGSKWVGVGCAACELRPQCTKGRPRSLAVDEELDRVRGAMRERISTPGGRERYDRRIATIEPAFSSLESTMGYRRASSRHEPTILAEVLPEALAHDISRLLGTRELSRVYCLLTPNGGRIPLRSEFLATL